jgi:acyl-coenzyme A thioesterase PaaI-like protein
MFIDKDKEIKIFHNDCFACGKNSENGLKLMFKLLENKTLFGMFVIKSCYQGYDNILHGGIISTILDSSMVNLFYLKDGLKLKTAKLNLRFIKPIPVSEIINIYAFAEDNPRHLYRAKSQILIKDKVFAKAEGFFSK